MKKNLLLAAMALPLAFASCSQEEIVSNGFDSNVPDNAIKGLVLGLEKNAILEGVQARANWNDAQTKLEFESNDKVSVYWLGNGDVQTSDPAVSTPKYSILPSDAEDLSGIFNSVFTTQDEGKSFTTQSMVFEGGNVAVFPADLAFVNSGDLYLSVPTEQDESVQDILPYISNQLYIKKRTGQTEQLPGYYGEGDKLYAPLKQAANIVNLTLNLSNIPANMGFKVQSVELISVSGSEAFASKSAIQRLAVAPATSGKVAWKNGTTADEAETLISQVWTSVEDKAQTLKSTALEEKANSVVARFVVLPTDVAVAANSDVKIRVNTNCGYIELTEANSQLVENAVKVFGGSGNTEGLTISEAFTQFVDVYTDTRANDTFSGENMGKVMDRNIAVDVNKAVLDGSYVYSSADIVRYAGLYRTMGKAAINGQRNMNLVMVSEAKDGKFPALTKAAVDALTALNSATTVMTLTPATEFTDATGNVTTIEVTGGGEVFDIPVLASAATSTIALDNSAAWTMNDNFEFKAADVKMQNNGTLTINGELRGTSTPAQGVLVQDFVNNGTVKIGGNGTLLIGGDFATTATSIINVEANQTLTFTETITTGLYGTINVNDKTSFLTFAKGKNVTHNGVINNYGTVASIEDASPAGLINASYNHDDNTATPNVGGVINVMSADAITYVYDNTSGTIVMADRTNEVKTNTGMEGKIVYNYTAEDGDVFKLTMDDRFTYVKFGSDINNLSFYARGSVNYVAPSAISMEFAGVTTLKSNGEIIADLFVNSGANLRVLSGNTLTVSDLTNDGTITIGGTITVTGGSPTKTGNVVSMGGAIN